MDFFHLNLKYLLLKDTVKKIKKQSSRLGKTIHKVYSRQMTGMDVCGYIT